MRSYLGKKTPEKNQEAIQAEVKNKFAPKVPEIPFEKTLDPVKVVRTVENLYDPVPSPPSDYRRSIERSYDEMVLAKKTRSIYGQGEKRETSAPARRTTRFNRSPLSRCLTRRPFKVFDKTQPITPSLK